MTTTSDDDRGDELIPEVALAVACIVGEAANQPIEGQVAVAEVIRNRTHTRYNSDGTIAGTLMRAKQFSCFNDDTLWRKRLFRLRTKDPEVMAARQAWDTAQAGSQVARGAVLYHTIMPPAGAVVWPPSWARMQGVVAVARIGDHVFYTDRND